MGAHTKLRQEMVDWLDKGVELAKEMDETDTEFKRMVRERRPEAEILAAGKRKLDAMAAFQALDLEADRVDA